MPNSSGRTMSARPDRTRDMPRRIAIVVNPHSGGAGPSDGQDIATACRERGYDVTSIHAFADAAGDGLADMRASAPDAVISLGGDGTHSAVLQQVDCPVLPLPGGTLNWLPKAVLPDAPWRDVLARALDSPSFSTVPGGRIGDRQFYLVAQLGGPALLAESREAFRHGFLKEALEHAGTAVRAAFDHEVTFHPLGDGHDPGGTPAPATVLLINTETVAGPNAPSGMFEIAAFTARSMLEAVEIGAWELIGQWRQSDHVSISQHDAIEVRADAPIPALLDGELVRLGPSETIVAVEDAGHVWGIGEIG